MTNTDGHQSDQPRQANDVAQWWETAITDMAPGRIAFRGESVENAIANKGFAQMIWHMVMGTPLTGHRARLFEAALVAAVDHGPQAPSIAAARMAATCGVGLNNAIATGVNMLGDIHGGAGEQAIELLEQASMASDLPAFLREYRETVSKYIPGFGHRYHQPTDPRAPALMELVAAAVENHEIDGEIYATAGAIHTHITGIVGRPLPMNIDGATAVIFAELDVPAPLARGFFCLSRSVGILAHAWEQTQQGGRNKGPTPPHYRWAYRPSSQ